MIIYLKNYNSISRMAIVAVSPKAHEELMERGVDVMHIHNGCITFSPGEYKVECTPDETDKILKLSDYDIVEISDRGLIYRAFANLESDATLFMGAKCNSNCIMCPASDAERRRGFSFTPKQLEKYIEYLPDNIEHLVITGGEPTLIPELLIKSLERVSQRFPYTNVLLLTNGRSLSDTNFVDILCAVRPNNFRVAIPLHGDNSGLHDSITQTPGSYRQTMIAIEKLLARHIKVEIRIVVTKVNCDSVLGISKIIIDRFQTALCVNFIGLEPRGNCAKNTARVYIDHRTAFEKSIRAIDFLVANGMDVGLYNFPLCSVDKGYWPIASRSIAQYKACYHEDCDSCDVKEICGGLFQATLSFVHPEVYPIKL